MTDDLCTCGGPNGCMIHKLAKLPTDGDPSTLAENFGEIDRMIYRNPQTLAQNKRGEWVPAIPLPFFGMIRVKCSCGAKFSNMEAYEGHYALRHILFPE